MDTKTFDSVFWISFITIVSGMILKLASMCNKSKCRECSICGGRFKIIRDIDAEVKENEFELTHQVPKEDL
jgi:hypothetical protein